MGKKKHVKLIETVETQKPVELIERKKKHVRDSPNSFGSILKERRTKYLNRKNKNGKINTTTD